MVTMRKWGVKPPTKSVPMRAKRFPKTKPGLKIGKRR